MTTAKSDETSWTGRGARALLPTYNRMPVAFDHGAAATLWDTEGRDYIDLGAGIAVSALGHGHRDLVDAVTDQARRLLHVSNLYEIPEQVRLAEKLADFTGLDRFFFCNSGTEANEAALKFLRAWGRPHGRHRVVVAREGFHGRTLGALSATAQAPMQADFAPLLPGIVDVPFGDAEALAQVLDDETAGVLLEPIQAEGGGRFPPEGYLADVRRLCDERGVLLVLDEVQTGMGRTGWPIAAAADGVRPDAVTLAKGLGGGLPIGALGVREAHADVLGPGSHGSTFGGNPLAARAAEAVVDALSAEGLLARIRELGAAILTELGGWTDVAVDDLRGRGLFLCFQVPDAKAAARIALDEGVLVVPAKGETLRILPPLLIEETELERGLERLHRALRAAAPRSEAS